MMRSNHGSGLIEAMVGFFIFIPLALFGADLLVLFHTAQMNEEFAEQLARLVATLPDKTNARRACDDVLKQYQVPENISGVALVDLKFDVARSETSITTSMNVVLPVPFPGFREQTLQATATQPILVLPATR